MHISFTTMTTPDQNGQEAVAMASRFGYHGVDIRISNNRGELSENPSVREIDELRQVFECEGISPSGILTYPPSNGKLDNRKAIEDFLKSNLEVADRLGSPSIRFFGGDSAGYNNIEACLAESASALAEILPHYNAGVVIQHHRGHLNLQHAQNLIQQVGHPRVGLAFSPDHCTMMGEDWENTLDLNCVSQIYVADVTNAHADFKQVGHVLPGQGEVPFNRVFRHIPPAEFKGYITLKWEKIWHPDMEEPEVALPYFVEFMKNWSSSSMDSPRR